MLTIVWNNGAIEADVSINEGYELGAEVTEHPVERGSAISDHVRPNNSTVMLEGWISNSPIEVPGTQMDGVTGSMRTVDMLGPDGQKAGSAKALQFDGPFDRVRRVNEQIQALINTSTLVEIHTGLETIADVAITRFKVDRNAETGNALPFVLECKRLRIVETTVERVPAPVERRGQRPRQRGNQPATTPQLESTAYQGGQAALNGLRRHGLL